MSPLSPEQLLLHQSLQHQLPGVKPLQRLQRQEARLSAGHMIAGPGQPAPADLQPGPAGRRHAPVSSDHSQAWKRVPLSQQEVGVVVAWGDLHRTYGAKGTQGSRGGRGQVPGPAAAPPAGPRPVSVRGQGPRLLRTVAVTGSQLHVHQGVRDDGQESLAERVSAPLPLKGLRDERALAPLPDGSRRR